MRKLHTPRSRNVGTATTNAQCNTAVPLPLCCEEHKLQKNTNCRQHKLEECMSDLPQVAKEKAEKEAEEADANPSAEVLFIRPSGRFVHS